MDYAKPPNYYDTFALRDAEGAATVMQTWPYFRSGASRYAMKNNRPVPVASCWNGMGELRLFPIACPNANAVEPWIHY
jgi:Cryptococcal mannosyltransferase 1